MTTVLLIHGIPGSADNWRPVAQLLGQRHRVLTPNLLGFCGQPTPPGPDSLLGPSQADHLIQFLDASGADRVAVVAHDFGGPVAAHLVARVPDRVSALALFATNAFPDTPIPFPLSALRAPITGALVERVLLSRWSLAMMVRQGVGRPRPALELRRYVGDASQRKAIATIFAASLRRLAELYGPVEEALKSVSVPALVGWGDHDPFFPVPTGERTAEIIPGSRFRLYPGAGHFLPEERPAELAADIMDLLKRIEPGPPGHPHRAT
jgi:pimeloyl-ACP methyl ester carboxylesterase